MYRKTFYQTDMLHVCISDEIALGDALGLSHLLMPKARFPSDLPKLRRRANVSAVPSLSLSKPMAASVRRASSSEASNSCLEPAGCVSTPSDEEANGVANPAHAVLLTKDEINTLPVVRYTGAIHLISTRKDLARALQELRGERLLGFDTETKPTFRRGATRPPALLQLATAQAIYLFQLKRIALTAGLRSILADPEVVKVGVAVHDDIRDLQRLSNFASAGFVDLGQVARSLGVVQSGLRSMAARFLGFRISKKAQCSNWEAKDLSPSQLVYAATDAWVSRELHLHLATLCNS